MPRNTPPVPTWEREFLIQLAAVWLCCRYQTMGNEVQTPWLNGPASSLEFALLGEHDYWREMLLLCREVKAAHLEAASR